MIDGDNTRAPFDPAQLCDRIDTMLRARHWSWADLSRRTAIAQKTFQRWRNGEAVPQIGRVREVAEAVGSSYEQITQGLELREERPSSRPPPNGCSYDPRKVATGSSFFGRRSTMQSLLEALEQRRSVNVVGDRRIGKSSLLRTWEKRAHDIGYKVTFVSGEMTSGRDARALVVAITGAEAPQDPDGAADALGAWIRARRRNGGRPPVILVDEFDDLAMHIDNRFFQRLRGMVGEEMIMLVLATCQHLSDLCPAGHTSPFDNLLVTEQLGLLEPDAAERLIDQDPEVLGPGGPDLLRWWAGRHPFYIKLLAHELIKAQRDDRTSTQAVETFRIEAARELRRIWMGHLSSSERDTLRNLTREAPCAPKVLRRLQQRGLLTEDDRPFGGVLVRWLQELT